MTFSRLSCRSGILAELQEWVEPGHLTKLLRNYPLYFRERWRVQPVYVTQALNRSNRKGDPQSKGCLSW
jgi:hypothetical protein